MNRVNPVFFYGEFCRDGRRLKEAPFFATHIWPHRAGPRGKECIQQIVENATRLATGVTAIPD